MSMVVFYYIIMLDCTLNIGLMIIY